MDDYRGGKFIVGSDLRSDEQRRAANEYFRNQNEAQRVTSEGGRNNAASNALGIANNHSRSNFLTQIGLFSAVVLTIIILATIAILAYEKSNDRKGLVDINNLRDLTLSNLDVNDTTDLNTLSLTGETTSTKGATFEGGLSVSGTVDFDGGMIIDDGVSIGGGLSVGTTSNLYGDVHAYQGVSIDGGLSVGTTSNLYGEVVAYQGLSIYNDLTVSNDSKLHGDVITYQGVSVIGGLSVNSTSNLYGEVHAYQGVSIDGGLSVGTTSNLYGEVVAYKGVSVNGGLSVNSTSNLYGEVIAYQGVSVIGGLSVNSTSNLYGEVIAYQGVSVIGGLSVNNIVISDNGTIGTQTAPNAITINSNGKTGIGIGIVAEDYIDEKDNLVVGSTSGNTGMTIVSGATAIGTIQFRSNTTVNDIEGWIDYSQHSKNMRFATNGLNARMTIDSAGAITIPGTVTHKKVLTAKAWSSNRINIDTTESGSMITIPATGANSDIGLPVISSSLKGWFITLIASADNGAHTITIRQGGSSDGSGTLANTPFYGILLDDTPDSLTGSTSAVIQSSKFKKGDSIDLLCDGTNYIITARMVTTAGIIVS